MTDFFKADKKLNWVQRIVEEDWGVSRIDRFLMNSIGLSFNATHHIIRIGKVILNNKKIKIPYTKVKPGDKITLLYQEEIVAKKPQFIPQNTGSVPPVIFKDSDILAINKPAGLAVQGGNENELHLELRFENHILPKLVHRIDKDVTGLLVLGRNHRAAAALSQAFNEKNDDDTSAIKIYLAVVQGSPPANSGKLTRSIIYRNGFPRLAEHYEENDPATKKAYSHYWVIKRTPQFSLVALRLYTGRKHQLRLHLAHELGTSIVGDRLYGRKAPSIMNVPSLLLHCFCIKLKYPLFPNEENTELSQDVSNNDATLHPVYKKLAETIPGHFSLVAPLSNHFSKFINNHSLHPPLYAIKTIPDGFI